ncbi:MAG: hypothetical protein KJ583_01805 [Nanoarchaeota archaeon]|nr:hypothetical protein [Nanoarchaeota archaeon]MBU1269726.1 hypothetical protein [Nanoarchaeota archaeon]MBU1604027.1 hypothetical protein [Nanoarchaeota archaeon]
MTLTEIKRVLEKRKYNLISTLENGREEIDLSRQHQIYGAIKEIQNILKTIDYHHEEEMRNNFNLELSQEQENTVLQKISLKFKKSIRTNIEE